MYLEVRRGSQKTVAQEIQKQEHWLFHCASSSPAATTLEQCQWSLRIWQECCTWKLKQQQSLCCLLILSQHFPRSEKTLKRHYQTKKNRTIKYLLFCFLWCVTTTFSFEIYNDQNFVALSVVLEVSVWTSYGHLWEVSFSHLENLVQFSRYQWIHLLWN